MLIIPLPPPVLDVLLAFDIMFATAVLVVALSIQDPLELAAFPSLLLVTTLFRLSLDVSATRLILTQGDVPGGVGAVIPAFGAFVMRGDVVVGMLLFIILIVVQLVVVTNGAQRVAEVAARFTLDAMPGKQMAIDADLHTGLIDAGQARARRRAVQAEADFYGAMDGAGKFVRGDAIAAIVIVMVNVVAGMAIGVISKHLDLPTALQTYPLLSIGNALATTLPAFLLSTAMGIMVTRAASDASLGVDLIR
ncbi:MAG: FHIPEP family type III secretion protein, partial [Candidatus Eremiobacteraeota bacterium]|nr:FHIPEP family type III secretion protein [Candidatus Eremiobacteraeota bacterium]